MNLKNSIYKLSFAAMISMMAMNATEIQAQGVVPAQKGEKTFAHMKLSGLRVAPSCSERNNPAD